MVTIDDARSLPFALRRDVEAQRRLYAVLSSPKRMFYVHGIVVLWDLHCAKRWITKDDFIETLATRFENYLIEGNFGVRDEFLDKNFSIEEEDCPDEEDPFLQARIVFRRLHETGWFELLKTLSKAAFEPRWSSESRPVVSRSSWLRSSAMLTSTPHRACSMCGSGLSMRKVR